MKAVSSLDETVVSVFRVYFEIYTSIYNAHPLATTTPGERALGTNWI
jgi:hypothetical protein